MRRLVACSFAVVLAAATKAAVAGDSEIEIANARQLAIQGIDAVEGGNCKTGVPLLERAEKLHHATVHLQYLARCRLAAGRLVAATEMWRQIIREGAPSGSSPAVQAAIAEANSQLPHTLPRLASTTVRASTEYRDIKVLVDGVAVRPELLGAAQVIDPGDHHIEAEAPGYARFSKTWTVGEGESAEVVIKLTPAGGAEGAPATGPAGEPEEPAKRGSGLKTAGFVVGAAGVIAMVAGTVTLLTRNNKQDTLASKCTLPDQGCAPGSFGSAQELEDEKQSVHTLTAATNVLMFGGGALLAGGVTMIVIGSSSNDSEPKTAVTFGSPRADFGLSIRGTY